MNTATILMVLALGLANGQLNFEGNPLTENTEYAAVESRFTEKTARRQETAANVTNNSTESSQNFQLLLPDTKNSSQSRNPIISLTEDGPVDQEDSSHIVKQRKIGQTGRYLSTNTYTQGTNFGNRSELALNSFLNSKTPEESRLSLDYYLQSRETPQNIQPTIVNQQQLTQQPVARVDQQPVSSPVNQQLTAQLMQQRHVLQALPVNQPAYSAPMNPMDLQSSVLNPAAIPVMQQQQALEPYMTGIQARKDAFYPGWYQRVRRVRGKPFPYVQSRGGPGFYGGPVPPVPLKQKGPPVEVIYTKPGFQRGPPPISNPPVPYEDASAWFPEADHPPPNKDVYYSQLYAQSYDPYYYNYIAKTGKIKPHLYGKFGKHHEEEGDGIWAELYRGFKKHGLKNIMTPTFLLGMTLPVVTLMLTALVQKRSLARSDSRELSMENTIQDYLEQIQRAVECYEKKRRKRDANIDGC
ncbi:hypothetical protein WN48_00456 [Eufriesea mexicana]|uniref:uncharacterized protein LOC108555070 isoform X2 n=1 Tax=Eufriesea mexicana TaxID=516756 RepID=UPI00083BC5C1|nr:PREDICTED: uncharacterized protein LOC108555070 isoform X2 [Eufriesea mexicana]OAD61513.1 hypothetical protein WN48_00456 [Eufriesea mexicana]